MIWGAWENTSNITAVPADFRFDSAQYEAELARAAADRSWEEPVDTVARLLEQTLADSGGSNGGAAFLRIAGHDVRSPVSPRVHQSPGC